MIGENVGFIDCLSEIKDRNASIILVGSTNGVSKTGDREQQKRNIRCWTKSNMHLSLHNLSDVENKIAHGYHCYGSFKRDTPMNKGGPYPCPWHYSGLFYWMNGKELFRRQWTSLPKCRHGIEMYPGYIFDTKEAYCLFNTQQDTYFEEVRDEQWIDYIRHD